MSKVSHIDSLSYLYGSIAGGCKNPEIQKTMNLDFIQKEIDNDFPIDDKWWVIGYLCTARCDDKIYFPNSAVYEQVKAILLKDDVKLPPFKELVTIEDYDTYVAITEGYTGMLLERFFSTTNDNVYSLILKEFLGEDKLSVGELRQRSFNYLSQKEKMEKILSNKKKFNFSNGKYSVIFP